MTKPQRVFIFLVSLFICSCLAEQESVIATTEFDRAEISFRNGIYERALDDYQRFVERHPDSPLADTARLRIRTIKREVSSMLENPKLKGVRYHGRERAEEAKAMQLMDLLETQRSAEANQRE